MADTVAEHSNSTVFVFVPNVCNAACQFCYVRPAFAPRASASAAVLSRAAVTAEAVARLGFNEVRFTGGEPTVFSNLDQLIKPFLDHGLKYRVLTNALDIDDSLPFFKENVPHRFTISVHDTVHPRAVFGVPISADDWARNRRSLADIAEVEATLVIENAAMNWAGVHRTLGDLEADGVLHIKIILENSRQSEDAQEFERNARDIANAWSARFQSLRYTDTKQGACKLTDKAFPAIDLGRSKIFACCVQVGDRSLPVGYSDELPSNAASATVALASVIERSRAIRPNSFPCEAGTSFCPLALSERTTTAR